MQFENLPRTDHPLVRVRPITTGDLVPWHAFATLPQVYELTSWTPGPVSELASFVWGAQPVTPSSGLRLAIARRSDDVIVGTVGFHTVSPVNRTAEITYDLAPEMWGRGVATHACALLTSWAHAECAMLRVQATVLEANERSARVLQRCGFAREGFLHSYRLVRGAPGDYWMYAHVVAPQGPAGNRP